MWQPDYVSVDEFRDWSGDSTSSDTALGLVVTSSSRAIDRFCSQHVPRQFGQVDAPEDRYYTARWDDRIAKWVIEIDDLEDPTGLTLAVDTSNTNSYDQEITDYILRPRDALSRNMVYTQIVVNHTSAVQPAWFVDGVKGTGLWGWSTTPSTVKEATLLQSNRINKRRQTPFDETGSPRRETQLTTNLIGQLDPDIETMLDEYVKPGWTM